MRTLLIVAAITAAGSALADAEVRHGADWIRITARPCADPKVLARLVAAGENPLDYRMARADLGGVGYAACWRPLFQSGEALVIYEDGDTSQIHRSMLKPVPEA